MYRFWSIDFKQEGPSRRRYNLLYTLSFFLELCIYSRRLLFYQCYPPGIASLIVGNTVINYFQIGLTVVAVDFVVVRN